MKPPKNLTPPKEDGKNDSRGFGGDDFRNYMSRKIVLQRKQIGLVLPPPPSSAVQHEDSRYTTATSTNEQKKNTIPKKKGRVHFAEEVEIRERKRRKKVKRKREQQQAGDRFGMATILKRLEQKHGKDSEKPSRRNKRRKRKRDVSHINESLNQQDLNKQDENTDGQESNEKQQQQQQQQQHTTNTTITTDIAINIDTDDFCNDVHGTNSDDVVASPNWKKQRPDLFFYGIVVLVNGCTNPDIAVIQRLLHKHGGDLEKYPTNRVTHIIAEHLSTAKANIYKKQRRPTPVCHPNWIVDSVKANRLLPCADYLIHEVRDGILASKSVESFFRQNSKENNKSSSRSILKKTSTVVETDEIDPGATNSNRTESTNDKLDGVSIETTEIRYDDKRGTTTRITKEQDQPSKDATHRITIQQDKRGTSIGGKARTTGTDPNFLESFFSESRLSFIGSYKQRLKTSPRKKGRKSHDTCHRFVFHVDMDCFFASVVLRNYPEYQDKPVAISHMGKDSTHSGSKQSSSECATCNYIARKYGIKKGMFLGRARELCPDLIVLPYDFTGYEEVSEQVSDILFSHAQPYDGAVEQVSCDESYVELFLPIDDNLYMTTYDLAAKIASNIRREIFSVTQCTASIGVASCKLLAKLGTDKVKPNNSYVVRKDRELEMLEPLALRELHGIGYRTDQKLQKEGLVTVRDVWDLGDEAEPFLVKILGPGLGKKIKGFCEGKDSREVKPQERKTIGAECNYGVRFDGPYGVDYMIAGLAKEVKKRMKSVGVCGSRITLKVKKRKPGAKKPPKFLGHGACQNLSKSCDIPATTNDSEFFARLALKLFNELEVPTDDVRGMGIIISNLCNEHELVNVSGKLKAFFGAHAISSKKGSECSSSADESNDLDVDTIPRENLSGVDDSSKNDPQSFEVADERIVQSSTAPSFGQIDMNVLRSLPLDIRKQILKEAHPITTDEGTKPKNGEGGSPQTKWQSTMTKGTRSDESPTSKGHQRDDLALPPRSQIHMSQVMFLPSPLRKQVIAKMQFSPEANASTEHEISSSPGKSSSSRSSPKSTKRSPLRCKKPANDENSHFRQASVKRMLKLAAVKTGVEKLSGSVDGAGISMTQLECLPLEMQLQIANNDERCIGTCSRSPNKSSDRTRRSKPRSPISETVTQHTIEITDGGSTVSDVGSYAVDEATSPTSVSKSQVLPENLSSDASEVSPQDYRVFYQKNILPLLQWIDNRPTPNDDDVHRVKDFLCLCVREQRSDDAIKMLRAIRNRNDSWGVNAYSDLLEAVDDVATIELGGKLDREWLRLQ